MVIRRTRDEIDRRRTWIELTAVGRTTLLASVRALAGARDALAASIAEAEALFRVERD